MHNGLLWKISNTEVIIVFLIKFNWNSEMWSQWSNAQAVIIGPGNGLAPNKQQAN